MENPFELIDQRLSRIELKLEQLTKQITSIEIHNDDNVFYTVQEAAQFLKLSIPTVYGLTHKMDIPFHKRGKRLYFLKSDLITYLKSGRHRSSDEILEMSADYLKKRTR